MHTQVLIDIHLHSHSCTASTLMYASESEPRPRLGTQAQTRNPGLTRMLKIRNEPGQCLLWSFEASFQNCRQIDGQEEPVEIECAYVPFCYEIKLEPSDL